MSTRNIQDNVVVTSAGNFNDKFAYTIIGVAALNPSFFAKVCAKDYMIVNYIGKVGTISTGNALIMQMRQ